MKYLILLSLLSIAAVPGIDVETTVANLCKEYKANTAKADSKYRDKRILLHGKLQSISANYTALYLYADGIPDGMTAVVSDYNHELLKVANLKVNDQVNLVCVGAGLVFNTPIVLRCEIK